MLDLAIKHNSQLQQKYMASIFTDKFRFYYSSEEVPYIIGLDESGLNRAQFVSLDGNGDVIGYLTANINRVTRTAYNLSIMSFAESKNHEFSADIYRFFDFLLVKSNLRKAVFSVVVGNPIQRFYDRLFKKYGWEPVGVFKEDVFLPDGRLHDLKFYEIHQADFIAAGQTENTYREV